MNWNFLRPPLVLAALSLFAIHLPLTAAIRPNYYFPKSNTCAVYHGGIDNEKAFTFWVENKRNFTVKADNTLKVAVVSGGKIIPPYQSLSLPNHATSQFAYRTAKTGDHIILIRGVATQANITICLNETKI